MSTLQLAGISYSLSQQAATLSQWEEALRSEMRSLLAAGIQFICYPELFLLGLSQYFPGDMHQQFAAIAQYVESELMARLASDLSPFQAGLCLGSGPRRQGDHWVNSSAIWQGKRWIHQDKLNLTPWEQTFTPGYVLHVFNFHGLKTAVLICFDIEQPSISLRLKQEGIDLIFVPSATMDKNGNERVNRCASARSIELGAAVLTVPLVGDTNCSELIDHNEGRQGFFLPAQDAVRLDQEVFSVYSSERTVKQVYELDLDMLQRWKRANGETKPYLHKDKDAIALRISFP